MKVENTNGFVKQLETIVRADGEWWRRPQQQSDAWADEAKLVWTNGDKTLTLYLTNTDVEYYKEWDWGSIEDGYLSDVSEFIELWRWLTK